MSLSVDTYHSAVDDAEMQLIDLEHEVQDAFFSIQDINTVLQEDRAGKYIPNYLEERQQQKVVAVSAAMNMWYLYLHWPEE